MTIAIVIIVFYVLLFMEDVFTLVMLIMLIVIFNKNIALILRYHGAEHKSINMYENIEDMSEASVSRARTVVMRRNINARNDGLSSVLSFQCRSEP